MQQFFLTDKGRVRELNEDAGGIFKNQFNQYLAVVADGMGGHQAGDIASNLVISHIEDYWKQINMPFTTPEESESWLVDTLKKINTDIYHYSIENESLKGMGTTVVISICTPEFLTIGHIGDSRCYVLNQYGFNQVTEDHSLVNELLKCGEITKEAAAYHPQKNVLLKALGTEENIKPDIQSLNWEKGDKLLLCSDGLTNKINADELQTYLEQDHSLESIGVELVKLANQRGGEDNISLSMMSNVCTAEIGVEPC